jgi:hypothetical protein
MMTGIEDDRSIFTQFPVNDDCRNRLFKSQNNEMGMDQYLLIPFLGE